MPRLKVILYAETTDNMAQRVQQLMETIVPEKNTDICRTMESFRQTLNQSVGQKIIVVIFVAGMKHIQELFLIHDRFSDLCSILILPEDRKEIVAMAHKFRPRFLGYVDSDVTDIVAVFKKILSQQEKGYFNEQSGVF